MRKGFTLMEILIAISIILLTVLLVIPEFNKFRNSQILNSSVEEVVSAINKVSSQTLASLDSSSYGIYFQNNQITIFKGTVFNVNSLDNEVILIQSPVSISNISLTGGATSFYFNRLTNRPNISGQITLSVSSFSKIISINQAGVISVN